MTPELKNEEAAGEIVGSLVLISIFVLAFAILAMMLFSLPAPQSAPAVVAGITNQSKLIEISHESGDPVPLNEFAVLVNGVSHSYVCYACEDRWSIGKTITVDYSDHPDFPGRVDIIYTGAGRQQLLASVNLGTMIPAQTPIIIPTSPTPPPITPVVPPTASFTGAPTSGFSPLMVVFTDTSTGTPTGWSWTFGDTGAGNTSTFRNPSHTYTAPGIYSVNLTVRNAGGSNSLVRTNYITAASPLVADFSGNPTSGNTPLTVVFTDNSTGSPASWEWYFGDGGNSSVQNPGHVYTTAGTYTVSMTATNAGGNATATKVGYITVNTAYTITESWSPNGLGYISISVPAHLSNPGTVSVLSGGSQTFSFVPNSNKKVKSYSIDGGAPINPGTANGVTVTYTFTNVVSNHTLVVTFG